MDNSIVANFCCATNANVDSDMAKVSDHTIMTDYAISIYPNKITNFDIWSNNTILEKDRFADFSSNRSFIVYMQERYKLTSPV